MAVEPIEQDMTAGEVKSAVMRLMLLREGIEGQFSKYVELVSSLYAGRAWLADGSGSWEAFIVKHDVRVILPRSERQEVAAALLEGGLPTRAAGAALSVSNKTIHQDAQSVLLPGNTSPATRIDSIGREQPATKPSPTRSVRQRPLTDEMLAAVHRLHLAAEHLRELTTDVRLKANRAPDR